MDFAPLMARGPEVATTPADVFGLGKTCLSQQLLTVVHAGRTHVSCVVA